MALAATGSLELATEVSSATGKELRAAGINWVYVFIVLACSMI